MRVFQILNAILAIAVVQCTAQHGVDPAYLQQYYQQVASQAGHRAAAGANQESTPIFESNGEQPQQYINPGQQIRLKDNVQNQVRAQQQPQHTQAYVAPSVREYLQQQQQQQPQQLQYVSQPQPVAYKQNVAKQQLLRRPQEEYQVQGGKFAKEEADDYDPNPSYQFGFDVKDDEFTNYQNRKEVRDGNVIKGSYSVVDSDGFIRTVKYTADPKEGFKAEVIREPTDIVVKVPTPPPAQLLRQQQDQGHQQYLRQQQDQGHQQYQVKSQQQYYQQ